MPGFRSGAQNYLLRWALAPRPGSLYLESQFFAGECLFRLGKFKDAVIRYQELLTKKPAHERAQVARLHGGQSSLEAGEARGAVLDLLLGRFIGKNLLVIARIKDSQG